MNAPVTRDSPRPFPLLAALVLVAAALLVYRNSFSVPFVYDDVPAIAGNPSIQRLATSLAPPPHLTTSGRPLVNATLALNHALGGTDVWGYHAVNLAIHLAAALTLFGLVRRTTNDATLPALTVALLWTVHPLQTQAVTYIVQRAESLAALFYLLTLYAFARAAAVKSPRGWLAVSVGACWLGMATKEVMVSAPLIVLLYDRTFCAGSFRAAWAQRRGYYAGLAASWLLLGALLVMTGGTRDGSAGFGQGVSSWAYALTQAKAIALYLGLALWPRALVFDYGTALATLADAWPWLALMLGLLAATVVAIWRRSALGFLGACFFAFLAPSSSVVPVVTEPIAEHRMYLPLAAVIAAVVFGSRRFLPVWGIAALALGTATMARNATYRDAVTLWADTVAKVPTNSRAHNHLAAALSAAGREPDALRHYAEAVQLAPDDPKLQFNLATALARAGQADAAAAHFEAALRLAPDHADAHNNYGDLLRRLGRRADAISHFEAALRADPALAPAHNNLGIALGSAGHLDAAVTQFQAALHEQPDYPEALNNLGFALKSLGRVAEAIPCFQSAVRLAPRYAEAHNNLALALAASGRATESAYHFREVIRLEPGYAEARAQLARLLHPASR